MTPDDFHTKFFYQCADGGTDMYGYLRGTFDVVREHVIQEWISKRGKNSIGVMELNDDSCLGFICSITFCGQGAILVHSDGTVVRLSLDRDSESEFIDEEASGDDPCQTVSREVLTNVANDNGIPIELVFEYARMKLASEGGAQNHPFDKLKRPKDFWLHYANATGVKLGKG